MVTNCVNARRPQVYTQDVINNLPYRDLCAGDVALMNLAKLAKHMLSQISNSLSTDVKRFIHLVSF